MFSFFHNLGIAFVSAFVAFTGALHSQPLVQTSVNQITATTTVQATSSGDIKSKSNSVQNSKTETQNTADSVPQPTVQNINIPTSITPPVTTTGYASYSILPSNFSNNPPYYVGTKIKISGNIKDFLANGDRAVTSNYIEIKPANSQNGELPYMMLQINSSTNYQQAVSTLTKGDSITAYGTITASQNFTDPLGIVSIIPVLNIVRIDKCNTSLSCSVNVGLQTVFPYTPSQSISNNANNNFVSISAIQQNPNLYLNHVISTTGKIYEILDAKDGGSSLLMTQDPKSSSDLVSIAVDSVFFSKNNIQVGDIIQMTGTLTSNSNSYQSEYGIAVPSYFIESGTITLSN